MRLLRLTSTARTACGLDDGGLDDGGLAAAGVAGLCARAAMAMAITAASPSVAASTQPTAAVGPRRPRAAADPGDQESGPAAGPGAMSVCCSGPAGLVKAEVTASWPPPLDSSASRSPAASLATALAPAGRRPGSF